jgi:hypothetical protein
MNSVNARAIKVLPTRWRGEQTMKIDFCRAMAAQRLS